MVESAAARCGDSGSDFALHVGDEMSEREEWMTLIRNEYDPKPDLGLAAYPAFDSEWDDGAGRIADAILADKVLLERKLASAKRALEEISHFNITPSAGVSVAMRMRDIAYNYLNEVQRGPAP